MEGEGSKWYFLSVGDSFLSFFITIVSIVTTIINKRYLIFIVIKFIKNCNKNSNKTNLL